MPLDVLEISNVKSKFSRLLNVCTLIPTKTFIKTRERRRGESIYTVTSIHTLLGQIESSYHETVQ